jgi:hypothetical protein
MGFSFNRKLVFRTTSLCAVSMEWSSQQRTRNESQKCSWSRFHSCFDRDPSFFVNNGRKAPHSFKATTAKLTNK